jgi:hypothetical protein
MDLSGSPDWDARVCYAVVLLCGLISARVQLYKRFLDLKISGIWLVPNTWLIFGIYVAIPLALFWVMDRMGAVNDTSLFAALLVGLAYPAIIAGGFGGLQAPTGVAGVLKPLDAVTDAIIKSVNKAVRRNKKRFEDFVVGRMKADTKIFDELLSLAKRSPIDVAALEKQLNDLKNSGIADPSDLLEKQARAIYLPLSGCPDFVETLTAKEKLMQGHGLKSPIIRTRVVVSSIIVLFLALVAVGAYFLTRPSLSVAYYGWRLGKATNSEHDRFRAREKIRYYLLNPLNPQFGKETYQHLMRIVRSPGLSAERVDIILQLLLQARNEEYHKQMLCIELIDDLRVDNVDARLRVHQTLLFLATERDPQFKDHQKELDSWNPTKGDSVPTLEEWIRRWKKFFREVQQSGSVITNL